MKDLVPKNWVVGFREDWKTKKKDDLAFFTFVDGKDKNGKDKLNSQGSWEHWRDEKFPPFYFVNDFVDGWKLIDDFNQRSGWNSNRKLFIVEEPRSKAHFELDVKHMVPLLMNIKIVDGVLQGKFAFTKDKGLISQQDYKKYFSTPRIDVTKDTIKEGDVVEIPKKGNYVYVGEYHIVEFSNANTSNPRDCKITTKLKYCFISNDPEVAEYDKFQQRASVDLVKINSVSAEELAKFKDANARYLKKDTFGFSKTKPKNFEIEFVDPEKSYQRYPWNVEFNESTKEAWCIVDRKSTYGFNSNGYQFLYQPIKLSANNIIEYDVNRQISIKGKDWNDNAVPEGTVKKSLKIKMW